MNPTAIYDKLTVRITSRSLSYRMGTSTGAATTAVRRAIRPIQPHHTQRTLHGHTNHTDVRSVLHHASSATSKSITRQTFTSLPLRFTCAFSICRHIRYRFYVSIIHATETATTAVTTTAPSVTRVTIASEVSRPTGREDWTRAATVAALAVQAT